MRTLKKTSPGKKPALIGARLCWPTICLMVAALVAASGGPSWAQIAGSATDSARAADPPVEAAPEPGADQGSPTQPGGVGPSSVPEQIRTNDEARKAEKVQKLSDRLLSRYGLSLGADYNLLYQHASDSPGAENAFGGVFRFYGHWTLVNRGAADQGALIFKVEHRHRLGTSIAPQALLPTAGVAGVSGPTFSDAGGILTNLYWTQAFSGNRLAFNAGIVDVTDYLDVYGLVNVWTDFNNLAFSTNPTIPAPNQGLGVAVRYMFTPNLYVIGGLADANGDPGDPLEGFSTFFGDHEYLKHIEFGWIGSWENRFSDNAHLVAWQVDDREEAGVEDGWGIALSWSELFEERWTPFLRAGYADGGGVLVDRSISAGVGYRLNERDEYIGLGANWGRPPDGPNGNGGEDQYTFEAYYRVHLLPQVAITPGVQYIIDPALDPTADDLWVLGIRLRATL